MSTFLANTCLLSSLLLFGAFPVLACTLGFLKVTNLCASIHYEHRYCTVRCRRNTTPVILEGASCDTSQSFRYVDIVGIYCTHRISSLKCICSLQLYPRVGAGNNMDRHRIFFIPICRQAGQMYKYGIRLCLFMKKSEHSKQSPVVICLNVGIFAFFSRAHHIL